jgi:putative membrane protein
LFFVFFCNVLRNPDAMPTFRPLPTLAPRFVGLALLLSGVAPYDRATWWMEVAPVLIAPLLVATHRRFPLTTLLQVLIAAHALVLIVGGAWTYARVPFGFWLQDVLALDRNPYDRIGHFMQGFVPAIAAREILLRRRVAGRGWLFFLVSCVCLAISAAYELIEWRAAVALGQGADAFLATQGDPWDTQSDMAMALVGALCGQILLGGWHDRQLARVGGGFGGAGPAALARAGARLSAGCGASPG